VAEPFTLRPDWAGRGRGTVVDVDLWEKNPIGSVVETTASSTFALISTRVQVVCDLWCVCVGLLVPSERLRIRFRFGGVLFFTFFRGFSFFTPILHWLVLRKMMISYVRNM